MEKDYFAEFWRCSQVKPASNLLTAGASNGHSYTFGISNNHDPGTPRSGLATFLFDCEFGLFDATPALGLGVWTPYARGMMSMVAAEAFEGHRCSPLRLLMAEAL